MEQSTLKRHVDLKANSRVTFQCEELLIVEGARFYVADSLVALDYSNDRSRSNIFYNNLPKDVSPIISNNAGPTYITRCRRKPPIRLDIISTPHPRDIAAFASQRYRPDNFILMLTLRKSDT